MLLVCTRQVDAGAILSHAVLSAAFKVNSEAPKRLAQSVIGDYVDSRACLSDISQQPLSAEAAHQ